MKKWPQVALGDLFDIEKGKIGIMAATPGDFPLVTTGKEFASHFEPHFSGDAVCIPLISATGHGHASLKRLHHIDGAFAVGSILCACINREPERVMARYAYYYLSACKDSALIPLMQGTANMSMKVTDIAGVEIPLPPLAEQQALVARLDALAEKTRQVEAHLDAVDIESSALLLSLHHKLAGSRLVRLGDVIELFEQTEPVIPEGEYPQVGVRGFGGGLFAKAAITGVETSYRAFNRLYTDAIVLSQVKGWEGAIALCPTELDGMFVSPEYRTFRCKPSKASPHYLGELVRTEWFWTRLQDATRGVGARRERTRPERFLNIEIPLPLLVDQLRIVEILAHQVPLRAKHTAIRNANAALVPATLERIFSHKERAHA
ncbi:restriction endonuclease subunit S [Achromobacter denitrificans]|uniref:restriction endonuclease subunit S n=1 Tax=Achromobacter denitrificans TaxID=32002 RepID=UPI0023E8A874|nr:restriction endonuclease subunit S [Achromobacter denitrificans]MDF3857865.1 restriction endonuclease subunit S [Achromobacter denitrificans]